MEADTCPKCGKVDWTFDAAGIHCACGYMRKRKTAAQMRRERIEGERTLADLKAADLAKAQAVDVGDETLASWYPLQLVAAKEARDRLAAAVDRNLEKLTSRDHPRWPDFWRMRARLDYLCETVERLERAGHVLVCPNHVPLGVEGEPEDAEGLALRGMLTGEGALAWTWHCETCQKDRIDARAASLLRSWRDGVYAE